MRRELLPLSLLHGLLIALMAIAGCTNTSRQNSGATASSSLQPATQPSAARPVVGSRPLIDFARGAGGFPLANDVLPDSRDALAASLADEYRARVVIPDDA